MCCNSPSSAVNIYRFAARARMTSEAEVACRSDDPAAALHYQLLGGKKKSAFGVQQRGVFELDPKSTQEAHLLS